MRGGVNEVMTIDRLFHGFTPTGLWGGGEEVTGLEFRIMTRTFGGEPIRIRAPGIHPSRCFTGCMFGHRGVCGCLPSSICRGLVSIVSGNGHLSHSVTSTITTNVGL